MTDGFTASVRLERDWAAEERSQVVPRRFCSRLQAACTSGGSTRQPNTHSSVWRLRATNGLAGKVRRAFLDAYSFASPTRAREELAVAIDDSDLDWWW